jgi:hypothetical protein
MRRTAIKIHDWLLETTPQPGLRRHRNRGAASLVEVIVAMAVSAVLLISIIGLLDSASNAVRTMELRADINERASLLQDRLAAVLRSSTAPLQCLDPVSEPDPGEPDSGELDSGEPDSGGSPGGDQRANSNCQRFEATDAVIFSAAATEICTLSRSRVPVLFDSATPSSTLLGMPRVSCVRADGGLIQSVSTIDQITSGELILNGAVDAGFTYFDAEADLIDPDPVTNELSESDLAKVRSVVFTTIVTDRLQRSTETLRIEFAVGAQRFAAEQSWRGRIGTSPTVSDTP